MKKSYLILLLICIAIKTNAQKSFSYSESGFKKLEKIFNEPQYKKDDILSELPKNINELDENKSNKIIYNEKNKKSYKYKGIMDWANRTIQNLSPKQFYKLMKAYLKYKKAKITTVNNENKELLKRNKLLLESAFNISNPPKNLKIRVNKNNKLVKIPEKYKQIIYSEENEKYKPILKINNLQKSKQISITSNDQIYCIGDIHGNYNNLIINLIYLNKNNLLNFQNLKLKKNNYLIFTGDYADRGSRGIEVIFMILLLKLFNPNQVFFIRGNHENMNYITTQSIKKETIALEISNKFLSSKTKHISTLILTYLDLVYSSMPHFLITKNPNSENKKILFCHGDNQSSWNDIYPKQMFLNQKQRQTKSYRGDWIIIRNAKFVIDELTKKGYSMLIKGHDHSMPKKIEFGKISKTSIKKKNNKQNTNDLINYELKKPDDYIFLSVGATNIGTEKFPIIVNISGTIPGAIRYYPTIVKVKPNNNFYCGWEYKIINTVSKTTNN